MQTKEQCNCSYLISGIFHCVSSPLYTLKNECFTLKTHYLKSHTYIHTYIHIIICKYNNHSVANWLLIATILIQLYLISVKASAQNIYSWKSHKKLTWSHDLWHYLMSTFSRSARGDNSWTHSLISPISWTL